MNTIFTEHTLLVESDPDIRDLIAHQAHEPMGCQVRTLQDSTDASPTRE